MVPRGLTGLGLDHLEISRAEVNEALSLLIEPSALPILIHCSQGKDRTGTIVLLALLVLGVPLNAIDYDYRLSDAALGSEKAAWLAEIRAIGLTDEFGETAPDFVKKLKQYIEDRHGGLDAYLEGVGFDGSMRNRLREVLSF